MDRKEFDRLANRLRALGVGVDQPRYFSNLDPAVVLIEAVISKLEQRPVLSAAKKKVDAVVGVEQGKTTPRAFARTNES